MARHIVFFFLILWPSLSFGQNEQTRADALFQIAQTLPDSVSLDEQINAFQRVIKTNQHHAPAYAQLAKRHLIKNTLGSRQQAETAIRTAIRLDPENETYHLILGDVLWARGFRFNASDQYKKILQNNPTNAQAAYWLGFRALKEYLKYQDMMAYEGDVRLEWGHFAEEDRQDAIDHFVLTIKTDPDNARAYYHLGLTYFENSQPESLLSVCQQLIARKPNDKNAYLYSSLAYQSLKNEDNAYAYYRKAINHMDAHERTVMESVAYLVDHTDTLGLSPILIQNKQGTLVRFTDAQTQNQFWREQDPLQLTPYNERQMEHYGRVAYANLRFDRPEKNLAGWQTDMGRMYIRYGRWLNKVAERPSLSTVMIPHTETWFYETFSITFRNWDGLDGWRFDNSHNYTNNHATASPDEFTQQNLPRYVDPYRDRKYSLPHIVATFQEADSVRIEMAYALPKDKLDIDKTEGLFQMHTGVFFYDNNWQPIRYQIRNVVSKYPHDAPDVGQRSYALEQKTLYLTPGHYHMIAEALDLNSKSIGTFHTQRAFTFPDTGLAMSDLMLASHIASIVNPPESRKDLVIHPNPLRTFTQSQPVFIYLEVYNLSRNPFGRTRFDMAYQLTVPQKDDMDPTLFTAQDLQEGELVIIPNFDEKNDVHYDVHYTLPKRNQIAQIASPTKQKGNQIETTVSAEYEGHQTNDFTFLEIDVHQLPEGVYQLTVLVTDQLTHVQVKNHVFFLLIKTQ